jgi:hypothetical protein
VLLTIAVPSIQIYFPQATLRKLAIGTFIIVNGRYLCQAICTESIDDILHVLREPREQRARRILIFGLNSNDRTIRVLIRRRKLGEFGDPVQANVLI